MTVLYSERAHERALRQHSARWDEMHAIGRELGRDSNEYREARQTMLDAYRIMRWVARRPKRSRGRRV